jgi:hypothetical protein
VGRLLPLTRPGYIPSPETISRRLSQTMSRRDRDSTLRRDCCAVAVSAYGRAAFQAGFVSEAPWEQGVEYSTRELARTLGLREKRVQAVLSRLMEAEIVELIYGAVTRVRFQEDVFEPFPAADRLAWGEILSRASKPADLVSIWAILARLKAAPDELHSVRVADLTRVTGYSRRAQGFNLARLVSAGLLVVDDRRSTAGYQYALTPLALSGSPRRIQGALSTAPEESEPAAAAREEPEASPALPPAPGGVAVHRPRAQPILFRGEEIALAPGVTLVVRDPDGTVWEFRQS